MPETAFSVLEVEAKKKPEQKRFSPELIEQARMRNSPRWELAMRKKILKSRVETTYDRLLNFVEMKGETTAGKAATALNVSKQEVKATAAILKANRLLVVDFSAFGTMKIFNQNYLNWRAEQKK